jgi:uncharacterized membrane protein (DUF485 family)
MSTSSVFNYIKHLKEFSLLHHKRNSKIFVVCVAVLSFVCGCIVATVFQSTTLSSQVGTGMIGERVTGYGIALTVHSVRYDDVGAGPLVPRPGYRFAIVDVTLENLTDQGFDFAPFLHFHVRDSDNHVYRMAVVPSESEQWSGKFLAKDMLREEIGFEVADEAKELRLYFEPGIGEQGILVVSLGK